MLLIPLASSCILRPVSCTFAFPPPRGCALFQVPRNHIAQLFDRIDVDGNGKISYLEFCEKLKAYELGEQA